VLFNLIKNALYYLAPYPQTRVTITVGDQQVTVRDNGPGIAPTCWPACSSRSARSASPAAPAWAWPIASA
jgi:K+-sensing histidine kinase KdpD